MLNLLAKPKHSQANLLHGTVLQLFKQNILMAIIEAAPKMTSLILLQKADASILENQKQKTHRLHSLQAQIRSLNEEKSHIQNDIELDIKSINSDSHSLYSLIRIFFNEIIENILDRKALLSIFTNREGHLEFRADILDELGNTTNQDDGHTYKKLLCIAFDMAVLKAYLSERYPRFVFHDGVFESLDRRKKEVLLSTLREYANLGIQQIITMIDSKIPNDIDNKNKPFIYPNEIILKLHDDGIDGRLFKMKSW